MSKGLGGVLLELRLLVMASLIAMAVEEFLERSPARMVKSSEIKALLSSGDLAKEPLLVEGVKLRLVIGGSCPRSASGKKIWTFCMGKVWFRNSPIRTIA